MAVSKKRKTTASKTATKGKVGRPKTKKFNQSAETGKIVSPKAVETDKKSTVTQIVNQDNDGVRADKGKTHQKRDISKLSGETMTAGGAQIEESLPETFETVERTQSEPALTEEGAEQGQTFTGVPKPEEAREYFDQPLPCLTDRPNKPKSFTCLDEIKEAIEKPQNYSEAQLSDIFSDNNLCANCKAHQEASE